MSAKNCIIQYVMLIFCFLTALDGNPKAPTILFLHHNTEYLAGMENHVLASLKTFIENGHKAFVLVQPGSKIQSLANSLGVPTIECRVLNSSGKILANFLTPLCKEICASIVFCQLQNHLDAVNILKKDLPIKSILKLHMHGIKAVQQLLKLYEKQHYLWPDGIICINHHQLNAIKELEHETEISFNAVIQSPSFFLTDRFTHFLPPSTNTNQLLAEHFNIDTKGKPTFCMIGNIYPNTEHKNYPLLLHALTILKTTWHDSFLCLIAGDGPHRSQIEALASKLGLTDDIIFLGYTNKIPELLHGCNFHVLSSSKESFGIAHVEAGLSNKATIGASETGADDIIIDGITGLIFKNSDAQNLALKIHTLLSNKRLCKEMGENAAIHIKKNLSNQIKYEQHMALFRTLGIC